MEAITNLLTPLSPIVHWLVRLSFAATIIYHGLPKLMDPGMGRIPVVLVILIGLVEIIGAILILYGGIGPSWATQLGGIFCAAMMLGAIVMVKIPEGRSMWDFMDGGMEFEVLLLIVGLYFGAKGNGVN